MKHLKLSLLFAVAMMSLCPSVAHAWQTVSGNVNVSSLTDQRIKLDNNTTITVDQDWYLREITGVYSVLTISSTVTAPSLWTRTTPIWLPLMSRR